MRRKYQRSFEEIGTIVADTEQFFAQENIDESLRMKVDLSLEELFVNRGTYNTETSSEILIRMKPIENGVEVSLTDYDVDRFDPTAAGKVDVNASLDDRVPGGLGLYLVLKMADSINYEYHGRTSKITFTNKVTEADV